MTQKKKPENTVRRPVQQRARQSVKAVVQASAQVLKDHGYKGATTNRIAERAGVSVGTIYQYFRGKDDILDALIEQEAAAYLAAVEQSMPAPEVPVTEGLRTVLEAGYAHQELIMGIREVMRHTPATFYEDRLRQIRKGAQAMALRFLESREQLPAGLGDLSLTAEIILALCEGMTFAGEKEYSPEQLVDILSVALGRFLVACPEEVRNPSAN